VVQDGSWWRSRWTQLESKPAHVRELEARSVRLHAALEGGSERVELLRRRLRERRDDARSAAEASSPPPTGGPAALQPTGPQANVPTALARVRAARAARAAELLLERASRFVCRLSGGRILAFTREAEHLRLQGVAGVLTPMADDDLALGTLAVRLAAASLVAAEGRALASLPIEQAFDRLDEEGRIRMLVLLRALLPEIPRIILVTRGDAVDARPELFDVLLEIRQDGASSGPALRPVSAGPGRVVMKAASTSYPRPGVA
jgi:hypothetical protein